MISLSSAEPELHAIVSGCSDSIFVRRRLEFLSGEPVEQVHFTDNSAAQQLASRHGVGRIRHLSGKILWIQDLVFNRQLTLSQIPTTWNYADIGTKPLARNRLLVLLNQIGAADVETCQMVGHEEFEVMVEKQQGQQSLKRVAKMIFRMAALFGLESFPVGADAAFVEETSMCRANGTTADGVTDGTVLTDTKHFLQSTVESEVGCAKFSTKAHLGARRAWRFCCVCILNGAGEPLVAEKLRSPSVRWWSRSSMRRFSASFSGGPRWPLQQNKVGVAEVIEYLSAASRKKRPPSWENPGDCEDLAYFLYLRLDELFNTETDDGSPMEVATLCLRLFNSCQQGDLSFANQVLQVCDSAPPPDLSKSQGSERIEYATEEDELLDKLDGMDIDEDSDGDGDPDSCETQDATVASMAMAQQPTSNAGYSKPRDVPEPIVDEDGFTSVVKVNFFNTSADVMEHFGSWTAPLALDQSRILDQAPDDSLATRSQ
eukprot:s907_g17.t1